MLILQGIVVNHVGGELEIAGLSVQDAIIAVVNVSGWHGGSLPMHAAGYSAKQYRVTIEEVEIVQVDGVDEQRGGQGGAGRIVCDCARAGE